jgi:hypothetical protein
MVERLAQPLPALVKPYLLGSNRVHLRAGQADVQVLLDPHGFIH